MTVKLQLLPKDPKFFELFVADGDNLAAAATALHEMVDQYDRLEARVAGIQALEKRGDEIDEEVNRRLEDAFVTPFDREDIHELVSRLDDVVDGIQSVAEAFVIYGVTAPTPEAKRLAAILDGQGGELAAALRKLDGLKDLEPHTAAIHQLEKEADGISRAALARLFHEETPPIEVIKWRALYIDLENAIDAAEDAAEAMERMYHKAN
jgi:predicted phosphate transport protein (TIGR00153 family)